MSQKGQKTGPLRGRCNPPKAGHLKELGIAGRHQVIVSRTTLDGETHVRLSTRPLEIGMSAVTLSLGGRSFPRQGPIWSPTA
jgi:hypothetical protein